MATFHLNNSRCNEPLTEANTLSCSDLALGLSLKKQEVSCLPSSGIMFECCYFSKSHLNLFPELQ